MTDLEMTKLCAEAMGLKYEVLDVFQYGKPNGEQFLRLNQPPGWEPIDYDPLHDDAQMVALVKKFKPAIQWAADGSCWVHIKPVNVNNDHFNAAVVECVAKMWKERK